MNRTLFIIIGAAFLFSGCAVSVCQAPVGEAPLDITKEAEDWEGFWNLYVSEADDVLSIRKDVMAPVGVEVQNASNGVLRVHWLVPVSDKEKEGNSNPPLVYDVYLRKAGDWVFASIDMKDIEKTNSPPSYAWGRLRKGKRVAYLWWASNKMLDEFQKEGKAPPDVPNCSPDNVLQAFNSNHVAQITSGTNGVPFLWDTPWLFIKQD